MPTFSAHMLKHFEAKPRPTFKASPENPIIILNITIQISYMIDVCIYQQLLELDLDSTRA